MKLSFLFCAFSLTAAVGQSVSPNHATGKRYHLITLSPVNWYTALYHCRSLGMHLVSISTREENDRIIQQIKDQGHEEKDFWISGTKQGFNDVFHWMGNGKPVKFADWAPNQPSYRAGDNTEDCMQIFGTNRAQYYGQGDVFKWNDRDCSALLHFICEEEVVEYQYCTDSS